MPGFILIGRMKDKTKDYRQKIGRKGEDLAVHFLKREGLRIVERNWRYSRSELDIIAFDGKVLVFIEVKTRSSDFHGSPESFLGFRQRMRLIDAANRYMDKINYHWEIRFDIVSVLLHGNRGFTISHIRDAFFPGMC